MAALEATATTLVAPVTAAVAAPLAMVRAPSIQHTTLASPVASAAAAAGAKALVGIASPVASAAAAAGAMASPVAPVLLATLLQRARWPPAPIDDDLAVPSWQYRPKHMPNTLQRATAI